MVTVQDLVGWLAADQAISINTTLANITGLVFPVEANRAYGFMAEIQFNLAGIVSGFKFGVANPASPTNLVYTIEAISSGAIIAGIGLTATLGAALATTGLHACHIRGVLENGANAGNLSMQSAQNTSDASALTIKRGSFLRVWNLN